MRPLPQPKNKQAVLYLVLIALTVAIAVGLRTCPRHTTSAPDRGQDDSVRFIPVYTTRE